MCEAYVVSWASVFRTSHQQVHINETSSYVDLAPLYGNNQQTQDKIRKKDGRGLLIPDTFAEDRLLLLPPAVCVLLTLFNRNHNVSTCPPLSPSPCPQFLCQFGPDTRRPLRSTSPSGSWT